MRCVTTMDAKQLNKLISAFSMADGGLYKRSTNSEAYFQMNRLTCHNDYIDWVKEIFEQIVHVNKTNVGVATAKATTSTTKATLGIKPSLNLDALKKLMDSINHEKFVIKSEPETEEQQLKRFIKDYIDEPPTTQPMTAQLLKQLQYMQMYGGCERQLGKSFGYHPQIVINDPIHVEAITRKPTKKEAKLLRKFRKLKRFK